MQSAEGELKGRQNKQHNALSSLIHWGKTLTKASRVLGPRIAGRVLGQRKFLTRLEKISAEHVFFQFCLDCGKQ
jgi:hypothetical protein